MKPAKIWGPGSLRLIQKKKTIWLSGKSRNFASQNGTSGWAWPTWEKKEFGGLSPLVENRATQTGLLVNPMIMVVRTAHISGLNLELKLSRGMTMSAIQRGMRSFIGKNTLFMLYVNLCSQQQQQQQLQYKQQRQEVPQTVRHPWAVQSYWTRQWLNTCQSDNNHFRSDRVLSERIIPHLPGPRLHTSGLHSHRVLAHVLVELHVQVNKRTKS